MSGIQPSGVLRPRPGGGAGGALLVVELLRVTGRATSPRRLTGFIQSPDGDVGAAVEAFTYQHSFSGASTWGFLFWDVPVGARVLIGWEPELQRWVWLQWVIGRQSTFPGPC
jgi:hypothetical protein